MIIFISSIVLILGSIALMIGIVSKKERWVVGGVISLGFDIIIGFMLCGIGFPVKTNTVVHDPSTVTRGAYNITAEYNNGETLTSTDARYYNADDSELEVVIETKVNSYEGILYPIYVSFRIKQGE